MFNKPEDYVFCKIKGKLNAVLKSVGKTHDVCEFAEGQDFSTETINSMKKDIAKQLRAAADQLEDAILYAGGESNE